MPKSTAARRTLLPNSPPLLTSNFQPHSVSTLGAREDESRISTCARRKPTRGSSRLLTPVHLGPAVLIYTESSYLLALLLQKDASSPHQQMEASPRPSSQLFPGLAKHCRCWLICQSWCLPSAQKPPRLQMTSQLPPPVLHPLLNLFTASSKIHFV